MAGLAAAFGSGAMTNSIAEIEDAGCIFVIGSNTTACHPLIARRILRAKEKGAKLIVADPREIQLSRYADIAVSQKLGSDVALLNAMMHIIIKNGWHDKLYIDDRTENFEELEEQVSVYDPPNNRINYRHTGTGPDENSRVVRLQPPIITSLRNGYYPAHHRSRQC